MKFKALMLGTAAFAVMVAPTLAATDSTTSTTTTTTSTTTKHHHHHAMVVSTSSGSGASSVDARIDELEREIHELKEQQAASQQQAPASDDQVSEAQFESLQNQVYEQSASTRGAWWNNTKISGRFFWDVSSIDASGTIKSAAGTFYHTKSPQDGLNYDLKRAYLMIDHKFNDTYSANLTTDATYDGTTKSSQVFIKKAYLQAAYDPAFTVRIGAADMPWVPFVEGVYGYRYVENVMIDRTKFGTSTDWGAHILGTFDLGGPTVGYQLSAVNGFGYKLDPIGNGANRSEGVDLEGRLNLNWNGFVAAVGGYHGKLGNDVQNNQLHCGDGAYKTTCFTANRFDALLAYTDDAIRVGVEYFSAHDYKSVTSTALDPDDKANGYSAFASYRFDPMWSVFGRYDWVTPTEARIYSGASRARNQYYNLGISYSPIPQLDFALVYKHDSFQNGIFSDSEFTSGGAPSPATGNNGLICYAAGAPHTAEGNCNQGTYNEIGIFGQVNF